MDRPGEEAGERLAELTREGDYWTVEFDGRELRVRDSKGMGYLAHLLGNPGVEISALALVSGVATERISAMEAAREGLSVDGGEDAAPLLDAQAKVAYKRRLAQLRAEQQEAEAFHDFERAAGVRAEYEAIARELSATVGLGGRDRRTGTPGERARLNVTRAIKASIDRLTEEDEALCSALSTTVLTGRTCVYLPDRDAPVRWCVVTRPPRRTLTRRFQPPETHYAQAEGVNIAYQVLGDGPVDLILIPGVLTHVDLMWTEPSVTRLLRNLAGFSRLIIFDRRGAGLSDPVPGPPTLEERADDICAVMDAIGSRRGAVFGFYEGAAVMAYLAATHPERVSGLALYGAFAGGPGSGYPGSAGLDELRSRFRAVAEHWGRGDTLGVLAPALMPNRLLRRLWGAFERASMAPGLWRSQLEWIMQLDIGVALPAISAPTLVLHCTGDIVPLDSGRYVADRIPDSTFKAIEGDWHPPFTGDMDAITGEVENFVATLPRENVPDRILATALSVSADSPASDDLEHTRMVIGRGGGVLLECTQAVATARFDGPGRAVRCAAEALADGRRRGLALRAGVDIAKCELLNGATRGSAPFVTAAELALRAMPGETLVTGAVYDLMLGSTVEFTPRDIGQLAGSAAIFAAIGAATPDSTVAKSGTRAPLIDRAAIGLGRHAPTVSRAALRVVKGKT